MIIDFEKARAEREAATDEESILGTAYYLCKRDENGKEIQRQQLDGEEYIKTVCPICGKEYIIEILDFCMIAATDFDFYGTSLYCPECSAKRVKEKK